MFQATRASFRSCADLPRVLIGVGEDVKVMAAGQAARAPGLAQEHLHARPGFRRPNLRGCVRLEVELEPNARVIAQAGAHPGSVADGRNSERP